MNVEQCASTLAHNGLQISEDKDLETKNLT